MVSGVTKKADQGSGPTAPLTHGACAATGTRRPDHPQPRPARTGRGPSTLTRTAPQTPGTPKVLYVSTARLRRLVAIWSLAAPGHLRWHAGAMNMRPLGDYEQLLRSTARSWSAGTVVHGSRVLDDLLAGIEQHRSTNWTAEYWRRLEPRAAAIGCVPWLTDHAVAEALASFDQCCIVVDKQQPEYDAVRRLATEGRPLSSAYLDGFDELALRDDSGNPPVIHPNSGRLDPVELGPVRVAGWQRARDGSRRPMLHSKVLVLGVTTYYEDDEMFAGDVLKFHPKTTWMGSANWTYASRRHIEFGLWSREPDLVRRNYEYLLSLLTFSEQRGAATIGPEPELVSAVWDNDAFREYLAEHPDMYVDPDEG